MTKPTVICLTPVKNEAWILERFLSCASLWADHIIVADQQSTDGSRDIAARFPKVQVIENPSPTFDERTRQNLLLEAARRIPGPRLLIALDADEIFSANVLDSIEWASALRAPRGTVITFKLASIRDDLATYWRQGGRHRFAWGFVDDGSLHEGAIIHGNRIPLPPTASRLEMNAVWVMHYQYTDWRRMESKHRWYQLWEELHRHNPHPAGIFRQYHHMYGVREGDRRPIPSEWFSAYLPHGIDMTTIHAESVYWWDREVLDLLLEQGPRRFGRYAIWGVEWQAMAERLKVPTGSTDLRDPRSLPERLIHRWLLATQARENSLPIQAADLLLRRLGW
jgi:glycosyltransferase involved in cell wall biosynthesis